MKGRLKKPFSLLNNRRMYRLGRKCRAKISAEPPQTQTAQIQETAEPLPVAKVQTASEPEEYPHMDEEIPPPYFDEAYTYEDSHRADVMEVPQPVASAEPEEEDGR